MTRDEAKEAVLSQVSCLEYLEESKDNMYCCPFCGSGHGPNKTGAVKYYPETNTICCFSRCQKKKYDVIDIYRQTTGADYVTALTALAGKIGVHIDREARTTTTTKKNKTATDAAFGYAFDATIDFNTGEIVDPGTDYGIVQPALTDSKTTAVAAVPADLTAYYSKCAARINDPAAAAYLQSRGITPDIAAFYFIGYDPKSDPAGSGHPCPRIIMPTSKTHYVGRRIDGIEEYKKMNNKGGKAGIFNVSALYADNDEVFVTEGIFDALSVIMAGGRAIALNSTNNYTLLLKTLEQRRTSAILILCLDNDEAGKKATTAIRAGLNRLNISFVTADISCSYNDPNDALVNDPAAFMQAISAAIRQTAARPDNVQDYIEQFLSADIEKFKKVLYTGFSNLDSQSGGLYAGLYAVAAISSLGKTTFCHQIADQLAAAGNDVLFFSLEQSRFELVSKSIARRTAQDDPTTAVSSLSIRRGYLPPQVQNAAEQYKQQVGNRLSIIEGNFACNLSLIADYIRQYIRRTGTRPTVVIDYLQILQPETTDGRTQTTKETIDSTVTSLKRLSREMDLTVFVVSSVNRANYLTPIDFESLKESGSIEYTADVVWGLQLQCLEEEIFNKQNNITERRDRIKSAKAESPRKIQLVCLKNRYGIANYTCNFDYYPANDLFIPAADDAAGTGAKQRAKGQQKRL